MAQRSAERTPEGKRDLNRAKRKDLTAVPGIGAATAKAIMQRRKERGALESLNELIDVAGVDAGTMKNLRARFTVSGGRPRSAKRGAKAVAGSARKAGEQQGATATRKMGEPGAQVAAEAGRSSVAEAKADSEATADTLSSEGDATGRGHEETARHDPEQADGTAGPGNALLEAMQELHREWLSCARAQLEDSLAAGRDLARCRSPKDLVDLQMRYARTSMERLVTGSAKLAELTARLAGTSLPLQAAWRQQDESGSRD